MFALDSLILTFLLAILIIIDLKRRESELLRHEIERELGPFQQFEGKQLVNSSDSVKELIDMFPQLDFSSLVPPQPAVVRKLRKWVSKSNPESKVSTPTHSNLERRMSFPLAANEVIEINPESLIPPDAGMDIIDEPYGEEILEKKDEIFDKSQEILDDQDLTMIQEEHVPEEPKEFSVSIIEYKDPVLRPLNLHYVPIDVEPKIEEYTEIVAFTEEDQMSEEEVRPITHDNNVEEFGIENIAEEVKNSNSNLLENLINSQESPVKTEENQTVEDPSNFDQIIGTVGEENELELDKAVPDSKDPEIVSVFHKETGQRVKIRKGFKGARIVDLENKIIDNLAPIDTNKYEVSKTIVDDSDVRFATMTARTGEKVRVKRSFKGARILDLEKKVSHPHSYLIGQSVKNESDFQFSNAYPDPDDPEVVVVMHNETGEDVKIRKTFHGAQIIDEAGDPVDASAIDRNDYDIPKTIVDKEDVHLATLKHKITNAKVKVRRNFRGAKIIDLEKKVELPLRGLQSILSEKSEPESLSPEISQNDMMDGDMGWIKPSYPKEKSSTKKKPPLRPIAITPKNDEGYDRRKLANLANLIDDLEEESKDWQQPQPYRFVSDSSDDDRSMSSIKPQRKSLYHNVDLDSVYAPEFKQDNYEPEVYPEKKKPKKKKKKTKKMPDSQKMRGLEDIYLQRLEKKKKFDGPSALKMNQDGGFFEPEWERTDSVMEYRPTTTERPISFAGEEIINPRFKVSTPRRDF